MEYYAKVWMGIVGSFSCSFFFTTNVQPFTRSLLNNYNNVLYLMRTEQSLLKNYGYIELHVVCRNLF